MKEKADDGTHADGERDTIKAVCERAPSELPLRRRSRFIRKFETLEHTGMTISEIQNISWQSYTYPDDLNKDVEDFDAVVRDIDQYDHVKRYVVEGRIIWVHLFVRF